MKRIAAIALLAMVAALAAQGVWAQMPNQRPGPAKAAPGQQPDKDHPKPQLFQRMDENGDGQLTLEEVRKAFPGFSEEQFKRADTNGDGKLSKDEWQAHVTGMRSDPQNRAAPTAPAQ
ncbi:EF-hand domain-containing protein [Fundidesulfovibrio agrisoli]|uniref:EF-hand domain-containing protein n=1 Tax=Fundidesulfovibrio agrisoli TaxID=2922717 RepID=UPI001FAC4D81